MVIHTNDVLKYNTPIQRSFNILPRLIQCLSNAHPTLNQHPSNVHSMFIQHLSNAHPASATNVTMLAFSIFYHLVFCKAHLTCANLHTFMGIGSTSLIKKENTTHSAFTILHFIPAIISNIFITILSLSCCHLLPCCPVCDLSSD